MRLTRALASLAPGLSLSATLYLREASTPGWSWLLAAVSLPGVYGLLLVLKIFGVQSRIYKPPRLEKTSEHDDYYRHFPEYGKNGQAGRSVACFAYFASRDVITYGGLTLTFLGCWIAGRTPFLAIPLAGIALAWLVGWVWWRINKTFLQFLVDFSEYA